MTTRRFKRRKPPACKKCKDKGSVRKILQLGVKQYAEIQVPCPACDGSRNPIWIGCR